MARYKLYSFIISPKGAFITLLKGDTIFGHFCWQCVYDDSILSCSFDDFLKDYNNGEPQIIFSSAVPYCTDENKFIFRKPFVGASSIPEKVDSEYIKSRKSAKKKVFFNVDKDLKLVPTANDYKELSLFIPETSYHNKINRDTFTTGSDGFAPYAIEKLNIKENINFSIFVLVDEEKIKKESIEKALKNIGKFGFGKDASVGMGKFEVVSVIDLEIPDLSNKMYYTLSPCVIEKFDDIKSLSYQTFVRFGKHGDVAATNGNPFKNPILMFDENAIIETKVPLKKPFIGMGLKNISNQIKTSVAQGYSIVLPWSGSYDR